MLRRGLKRDPEQNGLVYRHDYSGGKGRRKEANLSEEPPVILRGHDCDPVQAMTEARKQYSHLYTMWKYNGESLTTYYPRGKCRSFTRL